MNKREILPSISQVQRNFFTISPLRCVAVVLSFRIKLLDTEAMQAEVRAEMLSVAGWLVMAGV